jgi:hypothetical protein
MQYHNSLSYVNNTYYLTLRSNGTQYAFHGV